ncbi:metal ABC transporter ATP-binding protein [Rhizomicrobium electricum]|jgi:zinc transport system ATP-binding protein|uniref:Zinc ABC transporter ATP-binding protein ZnuC n=1 Tax=Rhizomicrobium electricum TaxID=480070 RepID=A0ABN1F2Z6_9PROT|nr:metal ABC transporter ATP-binding protein [Rhizomicrobium electricum]NIJ49260.1 zinc transport system ATP-binding protein [Rhizomicrobium electricum]
MTEPLITARGLSLVAGRLTILNDISLAIHRGEIVTVIGPNGSGKTTLLKALLGLIRIKGEIVRRPGLRIGYVPQQYAPDPSLPMTVHRFLDLFAGHAAGCAALERVGIADAHDRQLATLSGGELARVLLARAIAAKPDLLVLDEPLSGVDISGEAALYHLIADLRDELSCGILLVSHDLHVVMGKTDRVVCLNHHICCQGAPHAVAQDPAFLELFGDRSDLKLYPHHHDHAHSPSGAAIHDH